MPFPTALAKRNVLALGRQHSLAAANASSIASTTAAHGGYRYQAIGDMGYELGARPTMAVRWVLHSVVYAHKPEAAAGSFGSGGWSGLARFAPLPQSAGLTATTTRSISRRCCRRRGAPLPCFPPHIKVRRSMRHVGGGWVGGRGVPSDGDRD
jgi:hypothetical protein